jgi:hypothetical protein
VRGWGSASRFGGASEVLSGAGWCARSAGVSTPGSAAGVPVAAAAGVPVAAAAGVPVAAAVGPPGKSGGSFMGGLSQRVGSFFGRDKEKEKGSSKGTEKDKDGKAAGVAASGASGTTTQPPAPTPGSPQQGPPPALEKSASALSLSMAPSLTSAAAPAPGSPRGMLAGSKSARNMTTPAALASPVSESSFHALDQESPRTAAVQACLRGRGVCLGQDMTTMLAAQAPPTLRLSSAPARAAAPRAPS